MGEVRKVALVQPNLRWCDWNFKTMWVVVPDNLCLLAAAIENDYEVKVLDANFNDWSPEEYQRQLTDFQPDVVGLTMMTTEYARTVHLAAELTRSCLPHATIILGGIYATMNHETAIEDQNIDYLVRGEGDHLLGELLEYLSGREELPKVGLVFRDNGRIVIQDRVPFIEDLDALPLPAYHLIDYPNYINSHQRFSVDAPRRLPYARMRTSRGCPIGCSFCQVEHITGKKMRTRSVENVIAELKWLKETYGVKSVLFNDDNLILNKDRAKKLFRAMIDEKLDLTWNATAIAIFALDEEILDLMKESGCQYLDIAVESGVPRILKKIINKPVDLDYARRMVAEIKKRGMDLVANFIIGFPTETWSEIRTTLRFAEELAVDYIKIFIATPLPNTRLFDMVRERNLFVDGIDPVNDLNWSTSIVKSEEFTPQDLAFLRAYEWDRINFSNQTKIDRILKMMSISEEELWDIRRKTMDSVWRTQAGD